MFYLLLAWRFLKPFLVTFGLFALCPYAYGTAHWYVFDGESIHVISDGLRSLENGLPPEHVCKLHIGGNAVFIAAGHMGNDLTEPPKRQPVTYYSFDALVTEIMDSHENNQVKFRELVEAAKKSLKGTATINRNYNFPESRDHYSIEGALLWLNNGHAWVKTFKVIVSNWKTITVLNVLPSDSKELRPDDLHRLPQDKAIEQVAAGSRSQVAERGITSIDSFLVFTMDVEAGSSRSVGPPYARALLTPSGTKWLDGETLCLEKPEIWREFNH